MAEQPNIYQYLDYRLFLKDLYNHKKQTSPAFSHRFFAREAGLRSTNFLKLVMEGNRNLSNEAVQKFAKGFKLSKSETQFFESLVLFNQSKTADEKNRHYEKIAQVKKYNAARPLEAGQYAYFSNWYYVALRELVTLKSFREDPRWINQQLRTQLQADEIKQAIQLLIDLKMLQRNARGRLCQTVEQILITPEVGVLAMINFHREMLKKASDSIENSRTENRELSALTVAISKDEIHKIKERLMQFVNEIHALSSESQNKQVVYQLNLQFFNLSEVS